MRLRDEQGMMAIGVALMLIVVLSLFGGALWQYSMAELKRVEKTEQDLQALFLARAGAEMVMGAWTEESLDHKPDGIMDRIYYSLDSDPGQFQVTEPNDYLGYVDVTVSMNYHPEYERDLTQIIATAKVGSVSRTATLTTYPHLMGHTLGWYGANDSQVKTVPTNDQSADELVVIQPENQAPIHYSRRFSSTNTGFAAPHLVFKAPLDLSYGQERAWSMNPSDWIVAEIDHELDITADVIVFQDVRLMTMPRVEEWDYSKYSVTYDVVLKLPPGSEGTEDDFAKKTPGDKYGVVYFDGDMVGVQKLKWERQRKWFIFWEYRIVRDGHPLQLKASDGENLAGRAFYFKHGTNLLTFTGDGALLLTIDSDKLIPMESEKGRPREPFIWE